MGALVPGDGPPVDTAAQRRDNAVLAGIVGFIRGTGMTPASFRRGSPMRSGFDEGFVARVISDRVNSV